MNLRSSLSRIMWRRPRRQARTLHRATLQAYTDIDRLAPVIQFQLLSHRPQIPTLRRAEISRSQHARLTEALLRLRPFGTPKNQRGPRRPWRTGALFRCSHETSENFTDDISAEETLGLRACRLGCVRFGDCIKRPSALALERRLPLRPRSHAGVMPYKRGGVMATPTFCHALPTGATFASPGFACPLLGDVKTFSPESGLCQIKFFRWSHLRTDAACADRKACLSKARWRLAFWVPSDRRPAPKRRWRGCLVRALVDLREPALHAEIRRVVSLNWNALASTTSGTTRHRK